MMALRFRGNAWDNRWVVFVWGMVLGILLSVIVVWLGQQERRLVPLEKRTPTPLLETVSVGHYVTWRNYELSNL